MVRRRHQAPDVTHGRVQIVADGTPLPAGALVGRDAIARDLAVTGGAGMMRMVSEDPQLSRAMHQVLGLDRRRVAVHEAAHASLACILGRPFEGVSLAFRGHVNGDGDLMSAGARGLYLGRGAAAAEYLRRTAPRRGETAEETTRRFLNGDGQHSVIEGTVRLAGVVAEARFTGVPSLDGGVEDMRHMSRAAIARSLRLAFPLVVWKHWAAVQRVAAALLERHELTYAEVGELIG